MSEQAVEKPSTVQEVITEAVQEAKQVAPVAPPTETAEKVEKRKPKTSFSFLQGDKEIPIEEAMERQVRFKAGGEERTMTLDEVVRLAQNAQGRDQDVSQLRTQRDQTARELQQMESQLVALKRDRDVFLAALRDSSGDTFRQVQEAFSKGRPAGEHPRPADVPREDDATRRAGEKMMQEHIIPFATQLAGVYDARVNEIVQVALEELGKIPPKFLTVEDVGDVLNRTIPSMLEENGYTPNGDVPRFDPSTLKGERRRGFTPKEPRSPREAELEERIADLEARLEAGKVRSAKDKKAKAPPPAGEGATPPSSGEEPLIDMGEIGSLSDAKRALASLRG